VKEKGSGVSAAKEGVSSRWEKENKFKGKKSGSCRGQAARGGKEGLRGRKKIVGGHKKGKEREWSGKGGGNQSETEREEKRLFRGGTSFLRFTASAATDSGECSKQGKKRKESSLANRRRNP